jgi:DNA-binding beta-propeller fold protein YncE
VFVEKDDGETDKICNERIPRVPSLCRVVIGVVNGGLMQSKKSKWLLASLFAVTFLGLGIGQFKLEQRAVAANAAAVNAPTFQVDPFWPKPLPNHWLLGNVIGIAIDSRDHVYIVHRNDKFAATEMGLKSGVSECCQPAPPVVEFDPEGNVVNAWGGPGEGFSWPSSNHGLEVDSKGNVWIGGNGGSYGAAEQKGEPFDSHILKFSRDGKFLQQIGEPLKNTDSNSTSHFGKVAEISIDEKLGEVYVADGYGNKRIVVLDAATGGFKKYWGAYGNKPADERVRYTPGEPLPQQFVGPVHCAQPSNDGLLYVCDRGADRIQVFKRDGTFVKEKQVAPNTRAQGSTWDIAFSRDPQQKYMYLVDGQNMKVYVMDRQSLEVLYSFGDGGRQPGLWYAPHSIATDSKGNLYTTETYEGKRVQKFVYQGVKPVSKQIQGAQWPKGKT